jgi:hypothetical protein
VHRTRLAMVAFFFNFMMETPMRRACAQLVNIAWVSIYPKVQLCRTTSPPKLVAGLKLI